MEKEGEEAKEAEEAEAEGPRKTCDKLSMIRKFFRIINICLSSILLNKLLFYLEMLNVEETKITEKIEEITGQTLSKSYPPTN